MGCAANFKGKGITRAREGLTHSGVRGMQHLRHTLAALHEQQVAHTGVWP